VTSGDRAAAPFPFPIFSFRTRPCAAHPLTVTAAPADYPWQEFLLVRPDQRIAWRADDPAGIDLAAAMSVHPRA
jgi:hypothetical protein